MNDVLWRTIARQPSRGVYPDTLLAQMLHRKKEIVGLFTGEHFARLLQGDERPCNQALKMRTLQKYTAIFAREKSI